MISIQAWSGRLDVSRLVALHSDWVQAGDQVFTSVSLSDVLEGLSLIHI